MIWKYISVSTCDLCNCREGHHSASWPSQWSGAAFFFQQVPWVQKQIIRAANATRTEYSLSKQKQWLKFPARRHGGSWCFEPWENMEGLKQLHLVIRTRESLWLLPRKCWRAWSRIQHLPGPRLAARVVRGSWVCMADTSISLPVSLYAFSRYTVLLAGINLINVVGRFAFQVLSF